MNIFWTTDKIFNSPENLKWKFWKDFENSENLKFIYLEKIKKFGLNYPKGERGQGKSTVFHLTPSRVKVTFRLPPFPLLKILKIDIILIYPERYITILIYSIFCVIYSIFLLWPPEKIYLSRKIPKTKKIDSFPLPKSPHTNLTS